jgi:DNA-binding GntR family transcriptional regulator
VLERSVAEHRAIAAAILSGDAGAADAAMRAHLGRAAELALARASQCEKERSGGVREAELATEAV